MPLASLYLKLAVAGKEDLKGAVTAAALQEIIAASVKIVGNASIEPLTSKVPGKSYVMATLGARKSRPINQAKFAPGNTSCGNVRSCQRNAGPGRPYSA
jgi:hypothetical protein